MEQIVMNPIGVIHSPYKKGMDIPIQGIFKDKAKGRVELEKKYINGLKDLDGFSYAIILYYFHESQREDITGRPFLESAEHGIFAIRSPHRPNHIGFSIVKIEQVTDNSLVFSQVDMLDGTPVLDIKPYVKYFDSRDNATSGWIDKHFKDGRVPNSAVSKLKKLD